jgi:nicotinamidase-related amidase
LGVVGIAVCCQRTTILKWARRGGVVWLLKELCLSRARSENEYEQY